MCTVVGAVAVAELITSHANIQQKVRLMWPDGLMLLKPLCNKKAEKFSASFTSDFLMPPVHATSAPIPSAQLLCRLTNILTLRIATI